MLTPISVIQRREPFTSGPSSSVATISAIETANTNSAVRRICRGDRNDTPIITMNDGSRNITWRLKKWNGSSPIRVATGGLAASDRMTPPRTSAMIAASSELVHGPPPFGKRGALFTGEHGRPQNGRGNAHWWPRMVSGGLME